MRFCYTYKHITHGFASELLYSCRVTKANNTCLPVLCIESFTITGIIIINIIIIIIISAVVTPLQEEGLSMFFPVFSVSCMFCPGRRPPVFVYFVSPSRVRSALTSFPSAWCSLCHSCSPSSVCSSCHMTCPRPFS